jgi:hypothetical protein
VMASTSETMRPLKRSTMPLVCGVRGLIWRYAAPSSAQTVAKAWVAWFKKCHFRVTPGIDKALMVKPGFAVTAHRR